MSRGPPYSLLLHPLPLQPLSDPSCGLHRGPRGGGQPLSFGTPQQVATSCRQPDLGTRRNNRRVRRGDLVGGAGRCAHSSEAAPGRSSTTGVCMARELARQALGRTACKQRAMVAAIENVSKSWGGN